MAITGVEKSVELEVKPAIKDGFAMLSVTKIWGSVELQHRGNKLQGGMTWVPEGQLSLSIPTGKEVLEPDTAAELFVDLIDTLLPSIKVFINRVEEKDEDF